MTYLNINSVLLEFAFKKKDFFPEFPYQLYIGVLIDGGLVDDILCSVCISQGAQSLPIINISRRNSLRENHNILIVTVILVIILDNAVVSEYVRICYFSISVSAWIVVS